MHCHSKALIISFIDFLNKFQLSVLEKNINILNFFRKFRALYEKSQLDLKKKSYLEINRLLKL